MKKKDLLRSIPKVDEVIKQDALFFLIEEKGCVAVTEALRVVIDKLRQEIIALKDEDTDNFDMSKLDICKIAENAADRVTEDEKGNLFPIINATGTILHTNLGRAPLCREAAENVIKISKGYSSLEYNVEKGKRGSRQDLVGELIAELTGAEDAMVVNNNASATFLVLAILGKGKEVVVSRGELVEIGGAFRIPDIMVQSGAYLQEVGTSNKTKPSDYENAIITKEQEKELATKESFRGTKRFETGALMKVHKSNYDIVGFTEEVSLEDLVKIGKKHDLPVIFDMGNGLMLDLEEYGVREPNVPKSLAVGIDIILFSGDKLFGGPQAGIIAGKKEYIEKMKKHPLARVIRVDKMCFAALEATLMKYRDEKIAIRDIPVLNMISSSKEEMRSKAERLAQEIRTANNELNIDLVEVEDQIGGGSAPSVRLSGWAVAVEDSKVSAQSIRIMLRRAEIPILARIHENRLLLCVRTISESEFGYIANAFRIGNC